MPKPQDPAKAAYKAAASAHRRAASTRGAVDARYRCYGLTAEAQARRLAELATAPVIDAPAGFSRPAICPFRDLPTRRRDVARRIREARAELARRAEERRWNELLGTVCVPSYIVTDESLADRITTSAFLHGCHVRGNPYPLFQLRMAEGNVQVLAAYRDLCEAEANALYGAAERALGVAA